MLAFPFIIRDDAPFSRRELQVFLEKKDIQTRTIFTGNILRHPGFKGIKRKESSSGYPNSDLVMRGGMLIGCHHGMDNKQLEFVQSSIEEFSSKFR